MNLHVFTCGVFPSEKIAREKMWIMFKSAEKFGIDLHMYGNGTRQFPGYRVMCHDMQLEYLKTLPTDITHVLYTEGWDAFFTGPLYEIKTKYEAMGSPQMLMTAFHQLANVSDPNRYDRYFPTNYAHEWTREGAYDAATGKSCLSPVAHCKRCRFREDSPNIPRCLPIRYRYPQVGGYIAEREYLIYALERMMPQQTGDNCFLHYDAWKEGWYRPTLDTECKIFQVGDEDCERSTLFGPEIMDNATVAHPRVYNRHTDSLPCILHLSGGYTDPQIGKDARLIPWAKQLGIIE